MVPKRGFCAGFLLRETGLYPLPIQEHVLVPYRKKKTEDLFLHFFFLLSFWVGFVLGLWFFFLIEMPFFWVLKIYCRGPLPMQAKKLGTPPGSA